MQHNLYVVYRKMRMNAKVLPAEMVMVLKDFDKRLLALEGKDTDGTKKPSVSGRESGKVSKKKVPTS